MKVATWNVNSIVARLPHVIRWLEAVQLEVLCMQETKCTDDKFPFDECSRIGYCASVFGQQSYKSVSIGARQACGKVQRGNYQDQGRAHRRLPARTDGGRRCSQAYST